jgi:hypothetical protein
MFITHSFYNLHSNQNIDIDTDNLDGHIQKFKKPYPAIIRKTNNGKSSSIRQFSQIWLLKITRKKGKIKTSFYFYFFG